VRTARTADEAIGTYRVFVRNLGFYTGLKHTDLIHDEHIADWLSKNPRALIVMPAAEADRMEGEGRVTFRRLAELPYFNDGGIRLRMLLQPEPARDVERVVLVAVP
jgi:hypothetical protein